MKKTLGLLTLAGLTILIGPVGSINAQSVGDDGIAASPRLRQILTERKASANAAATGSRDAGYKAVRDDGIAASPKQRQILNEKQVAAGGTGGGMPVTSYRDAGYKAVGDDGIAASPKMRQLLNEQKPAFQVAPMK